MKKLERRRSIYQKTSAVPMKNGKIVLASIKPISSDYSETSIELNIYDPADDSFGTGITLNAYSQYISCYEQKENDVYCVYVSFENPFVSKLRIKRLQISNNNNKRQLHNYPVITQNRFKRNSENYCRNIKHK